MLRTKSDISAPQSEGCAVLARPTDPAAALLPGVPRMMFAVARVKRAETALPGLHGAVEVVTRGRHVEQLSGREHLAVPGDARPMARILRLPRLHGPGVDHRRGLAGEREHEPRQPAFHVLALDLQSKEWPTLLDNRLEDSFVEISHLLGCGFGNAEQSAELVAADLPDSGAAVLFGPVGFEGDARRQLEADRADHTAAIRGKLMGAKADVRNREEWWRSHGTEEFEAAKQIIDVARAASREARDANVFKRGRLLRNAEQVAGEQSERLRGAVPWLEDADIPADWDQANRFRMRTTKAIYDHDMQPRTRLVAELERRLEQAERAESERPSPEQVKALALRMAEQRERAAEDPTQDMNRPEPSGDEPLDLSEPEDLGESGPFEERSAPRTKADLLREIRQRADRRTGQQEAEQRQIDPWQAQPPQRRGHGR